MIEGDVHGTVHKRENVDHILELEEAWNQDRYRAFKVKSHRKIESAENVRDLCIIIGNDVADKSAALALQNDGPKHIELCKDIARRNSAERADLVALMRFLVHHNKAHKHAIEDENKDKAARLRQHENNQVAIGEESLAFLRNWHGESPPYTGYQLLHEFSAQAVQQGADLARMVWAWWTTLQWSKPEEAQQPQSWGTSWAELLFNWFAIGGSALPVLVKDHDGSKHTKAYVRLDSEIGLLQPELGPQRTRSTCAVFHTAVPVLQWRPPPALLGSIHAHLQKWFLN